MKDNKPLSAEAKAGFCFGLFLLSLMFSFLPMADAGGPGPLPGIPVPLSQGGTAGVTAAEAIVNLGVASSAGPVFTGQMSAVSATFTSNLETDSNLQVDGTATVAGQSSVANASASGNLQVDGNVGVGALSATQRAVFVQNTDDSTPVLSLRGYTTGADGARTAIIRFSSSDDANWAVGRYDAYTHSWHANGGEVMTLNTGGTLAATNVQANSLLLLASPSAGIPTAGAGRIYYSGTDQKFYGCADGSTWEEIDLTP